MGGANSGRRGARPTDEARDAVQFFLEIYENGITIPELAAFTELPRTLVQSQVQTMLTKDHVYKTHPDMGSTVWHLTHPPAPAAKRGLSL